MKKNRNRSVTFVTLMTIVLLLTTTLAGCAADSAGNAYNNKDIYAENAGSSSDGLFDGDYEIKEAADISRVRSRPMMVESIANIPVIA